MPAVLGMWMKMRVVSEGFDLKEGQKLVELVEFVVFCGIFVEKLWESNFEFC